MWIVFFRGNRARNRTIVREDQDQQHDRQPVLCAAHVVLLRDDQVLLQRRYNTGYEDGRYSLPAGHVEAGESVSLATARETMEEIGVAVHPDQLQFAHVMHRYAEGPSRAALNRVDFFLCARDWTGDPTIKEADKADDLSWFPVTALPTNIVPYIRTALDAISQGQRGYSEFGWPTGQGAFSLGATRISGVNQRPA